MPPVHSHFPLDKLKVDFDLLSLFWDLILRNGGNVVNFSETDFRSAIEIIESSDFCPRDSINLDSVPTLVIISVNQSINSRGKSVLKQ